MATQNVVTTQKPYQAPYLDYGFEEAKNLYEQGAPEYFPGETYAGLNQTQIDALNALGIFTPGSADNMFNLGTTMMGNMGSAMDTMNTVANAEAPQASMMTMEELNSYAPMIDQMVNAATQQGMRTYNEQFMPQLNANAAASGNMGSSRAGIAQGIAQRGIAENAMNVGANAVNNLFNQGNLMNTANANLQLNTLGQNLGAANAMAGMGLAGAGLQAQADQLTQSGLNTNLAAGDIMQQDSQNQINADMDEYNYNANADMNFLKNYLAMIQGNYGGTGSQSGSTSEPSFARQLLGAGLNLAGNAFAGGFNPFSANFYTGQGNGGFFGLTR